MKKLFSLLLGAVLLLSLTACGETQVESHTAAPSPDITQAPETVATPSPDTGSGSGRSIVIYFSATGNTERVASYIAEITGTDIFAIEPATPYTSEDRDYRDAESRVSVEHADPALQNVELVSDSVDGWEEYDTVYIGYPIWWGVAAWPVSSFVSQNDFDGKTIVPFCTSASSGASTSSENLQNSPGTVTGSSAPGLPPALTNPVWPSGLPS